jgi:preprotein translocase subunit SecA
MARAEVYGEEAACRPGACDESTDEYKAAYTKYKAQTDAEKKDVVAAGGLHILGTERHESRRIDNQLRGRAGRQGDPGSSRFYLSLGDDLMRIFAGEWVASVLTRLGMEEGQAIESRMVSRRIEAAQKKVEERNFDIRKNLLEYDEVMDHQRKKVYGYRQEILEGANTKLLILDMLQEQIDQAVDRLIDPGYGSESFAEFASHRLGVEFDGSEFARSSFNEAVQTAKTKASRQASSMIQEAIEENLNPDADAREWNWEAMAGFLKSRWGLKANARELKQTGRENLVEHLLPQAAQAIEAVDLSQGEEMLQANFGRRMIADWAKHKFQISLSAEELADKGPGEIKELLRKHTEALYTQKEIEFPVQVGLANFMAERAQAGAHRYDREGLYAWARGRFPEAVHRFSEEAFRTHSRSQLRQLLIEASRRCYPAQGQEQIAERLDQHLGTGDQITEEQAGELAAWAATSLHLAVDPAQLQHLDQQAARQVLSNAFDDRYRPEMRAMERSLVLNMLDAAWKDHLYAMDHLRATVGLRGYAQVDPKTEYKREGMKLFDAMWAGVQAKVTDLVFRMEEAAESFAETLWQIGAAVHEQAPRSVATPDGIRAQQEQAIAGSQQSDKKIEPIRNRGQKVGRNDPCPCGSGKKYKNCCMRTAV